MKGKKKCALLKEIRAKIASENDIPYVVEDCPHKGDCSGTCPKCEQDLRELEQALEQREKAGKPITLTSIAKSIREFFTGSDEEGETQALAGDVALEYPPEEPVRLLGEVVEADYPLVGKAVMPPEEPTETGEQ